MNIPEEVRRLLKKGADANGRNNDNFTMLQLAVRNRHDDCLEILIRDGQAKLDKKGGPYVLQSLSLSLTFARISF